MTAAEWSSLIEHALWPAVVLTLGLVLREPIASVLGSLAGRVSKVSVMSVTVELAEARPTEPPWQSYGGDDVRGLVAAAQVNDSAFWTLREALQAPGSADYFVVDLLSGDDEWLSTRLYLFSYLLSRLKGVRAVVFVATRGDVGRSFLGVGSVDGLLRALAASQPWLREARLEAEAGQVGRLPNPPVPPAPPVPGVGSPVPPVPADADEWWAGVRSGTNQAEPLYVAQQFLERVQWQQPSGSTDPEDGWLRLPGSGPPATWEHATWLRSADVVDGSLRDAVEAESCVVDDPSWAAAERVRAVASAPGDYVALIRPSRRFDRLIDRRSLLLTLGEDYARAVDAR